MFPLGIKAVPCLGRVPGLSPLLDTASHTLPLAFPGVPNAALLLPIFLSLMLFVRFGPLLALADDALALALALADDALAGAVDALAAAELITNGFSTCAAGAAGAGVGADALNLDIAPLILFKIPLPDIYNNIIL